MLILQLVVLLTLANGAPVIAKRILGKRLARPLDGGARFTDGRPLFGASKTIRGVVVSVPVTALAAPVIGLTWQAGAVIAAAAMFGDLCSSFVKRRMNLPPSSMALGLDQLPESLFPLLASRKMLALTTIDMVTVVAVFFVSELFLSRVLYRLHIRDHPY